MGKHQTTPTGKTPAESALGHVQGGQRSLQWAVAALAFAKFKDGELDRRIRVATEALQAVAVRLDRHQRGEMNADEPQPPRAA